MVKSVLEKMILYFGNDSRRINHSLKVFGFSTLICDIENLSDWIEERRVIAFT